MNQNFKKGIQLLALFAIMGCFGTMTVYLVNQSYDDYNQLAQEQVHLSKKTQESNHKENHTHHKNNLPTHNQQVQKEVQIDAEIPAEIIALTPAPAQAKSLKKSKHHSQAGSMTEPKHKCVHAEKMVPWFEQHQKDISEHMETNPHHYKEYKSWVKHEEKLSKQKKAHKAQFGNFNFHVDYSNIRSLSQDYQDFVEFKLIPAAKAYFETMFQVDKLNQRLKMPEFMRGGRKTCVDARVPDEHIDNGVDADYLMYVFANNEDNNVLAYASACGYLGPNKRPISGSFTINMHHLTGDIESQRWFVWIETVIHEMMHALGFSPGLWNYFQNPAVEEGSQRRWVIAPEVVAYGQEYFGCQNFNKLPIEENGGGGSAGAHWERVTFGNEGMTASDFGDAVFSKFTLLFFKSSGWYSPYLDKAQPLGWGHKAGCPTMQGQCDASQEEHCTGQAKKCDINYSGIGQCTTSDTFAPGCGFIRKYSNRDCESAEGYWLENMQEIGGVNGPYSRCFNIQFNNYSEQSACFIGACFNGKMYVSIGQWYICEENQSVKTDKGTVKCPEDIASFCNVEEACPNSCTGQGTCIFPAAGMAYCECYQGYSGKSCQDRE